MNNAYRLLLAVLVLALLPAALLAQDDDEATTSGKVMVGYWDSSVDGSPDLAAEYSRLGNGPDVRLFLDSIQDWGAVEFKGVFKDSVDQDYALGFDVNRVFRSQNTLSTLIHRLGHQPIEHFERLQGRK